MIARNDWVNLVSRRRVEIAGITVHPDERWMQQIARNVTMEGGGTPADSRRRGDVRRGRELKRSGSQIGAELRRHRAQPLPLLDVLAGNVPRRLAIVVPRAAGDEAGVQRRADHKLYIALTRHGKDVVERI